MDQIQEHLQDPVRLAVAVFVGVYLLLWIKNRYSNSDERKQPDYKLPVLAALGAWFYKHKMPILSNLSAECFEPDEMMYDYTSQPLMTCMPDF